MTTRPEFPDSKHFKIETAAERVFAAIAKDEGGAICNVGIVDLGESLVVFDSFLTPQAAQELRSILKRTLDKPIQ